MVLSSAEVGELLLRLLLIIITARIFGYIAEKLKQPAVLGELLAGVLLGPSILHLISVEDPVLKFLSEIGVIILLFTVGLESNIYQLMKVGRASFLVACIGVALPMALAYAYFMFSHQTSAVALIVGGTLTATSVGITSRVLSDLGKTSSEEGKIILGAAVIDDVLGLIVLAVVLGIVSSGHFSIINVVKLSFYSVLFLAGSIYLGIRFMPSIYGFIHKIKLEETFVVAAFIFAIALSIAANLIGLATVVGAFAAGLILERSEHKKHYHENMKPVADIFVPVFFVIAGSMMNIRTLFELNALIPILILTLIAVVGKIFAGIGAFGTLANKFHIGLGMIPRGEVGLIFAAYGIANGIINQELYSILVVVIMLTTFVTPPLLFRFMGRANTTVAKN